MNYISYEELLKEMEEYSVKSKSIKNKEYYIRMWYTVTSFISKCKNAVKFAIQRVYRGYDDRMLWSFNYHVANLYTKWYEWERAHGNTDRDEEEREDLKKIYDALSKYDDITTLKEHKKIMRLFADRFHTMWD